jgi:hypothetical protein
MPPRAWPRSCSASDSKVIRFMVPPRPDAAFFLAATPVPRQRTTS